MSLPLPPLSQDPRPSEGEGASELDLLRIVCAVAWCDGDFSDDEHDLLRELVGRYLSPPDGQGPSAAVVELVASRAAPAGMLDTLAASLASDEDRQLALKLAYMMVRVARSPGDQESINPSEKRTYRRLVEILGLSQAEIEATEWAAEQELRQHGGGLRGLLRRRFGGLGAWPDSEVLREPGSPRL